MILGPKASVGVSTEQLITASVASAAVSAGAGAISTEVELKRGRKTSGAGAPLHNPEVSAQTYIDIVSGQVYEWWNATWH